MSARDTRKKPGKKRSPSPDKTPRTLEKPSSDGERISWHLGSFDFDGPWGKRQISSDFFQKELLPKIANIETMTWAQIKAKKKNNHSIGLEKLIKDARDRLKEIGQDDVDELFSLRLSDDQRLFGIQDRHIFKVLWWDPKHQICPSGKKHT